jgi:hypothetical protein
MDSNNSSSMVGTMFINLNLLVTRNSLQPSPLCSTRQKSRWMRMLGFAEEQNKARFRATASRFGASLVG